MTTVAESHQLLREQIETDNPVVDRGLMQSIDGVVSRHAASLKHLAGEPDSRNNRVARRDVDQVALEEIAEIKSTISKKWGGAIDTAKAKLLAVDEPADRLRTQAMWTDIAASNLDPVDVAAAWGTMPEELKTAMLSAPPKLVNHGSGSGLQIQELVSPELRLSEMSERRPDAANQLAGAERTEGALMILANHVEQGLRRQ